LGYKGRDVEVVLFTLGQCLVAACDSCGAVGSKELDLVKVPPYVVGRFTTRVALLEIITVGAVPQLLTVAIANEPEPTGTEILHGVKDELASFQVSSLPIAISTEKNFPTRQTGLGVSVIGLCERATLRIATSQPGDLLYCLGLPKIGPEVQSPDDPQIVNSSHLQKLLAIKEIHDIIPVGSQGSRAEAELLAANLQCRMIFDRDIKIDLSKSSGPATCLIFTVPPLAVDLNFDAIPCYKIGRIV
jgi:hypothetical protein